MRRDWDYWNTIDYARKEGKEEGHAEGLAEGEAKAKQTIALRLLAAGLSVEAVATGTALTVEQVRALQNAKPEESPAPADC